MSIELKKFHRTKVFIKAVRYEGLKMDNELYARFKNDFSFAYGWAGDRYIVSALRGLKTPHTGDWLIYDEEVRSLIDIMPDELFQKTYTATKEV